MSVKFISFGTAFRRVTSE